MVSKNVFSSNFKDFNFNLNAKQESQCCSLNKVQELGKIQKIYLTHNPYCLALPCAVFCVCEQVPSSEEAVTPSSAMTPSASGASSRPFIPVTDDPGAASIIAETMTKTKEVSLVKLSTCVC